MQTKSKNKEKMFLKGLHMGLLEDVEEMVAETDEIPYEVQQALDDAEASYHSKIAELCQAPYSQQRSDQLITTVCAYANESERIYETMMGRKYDDVNYRGVVRSELFQRITMFLSEEHSRQFVRYHARGFSTTHACEMVIGEDAVLVRLSKFIGTKELREKLVRKYSYLKPDNVRFPKKYQLLWEDARNAYITALSNTTGTTAVEQIYDLQKRIAFLDENIEQKSNMRVKEYCQLLNERTKMMNLLWKFTVEQPHKDVLNLLNSLYKIGVFPNPQQMSLSQRNDFVETLLTVLKDKRLAFPHQNESEQNG